MRSSTNSTTGTKTAKRVKPSPDSGSGQPTPKKTKQRNAPSPTIPPKTRINPKVPTFHAEPVLSDATARDEQKEGAIMSEAPKPRQMSGADTAVTAEAAHTIQNTVSPQQKRALRTKSMAAGQSKVGKENRSREKPPRKLSEGGGKVKKIKAQESKATDTPHVPSAREQILATLEPRLDEEGNKFARLCMDHVLERAGKHTALLADDEFINAIQRSLESVKRSRVSQEQEALAFKLNFNLNLQNLLERHAGAGDNPDQAWEDWVVQKLGPKLAMPMLAARGMSQVLLNRPDAAPNTLAASMEMSGKLLDKVLGSKELKDKQLSPGANLAMALRNVVVREFELHDEISEKLAKSLVKAAKPLLKEGGQANAVGWTLQLLKVAEDWHGKNQ